MYPMEGGPGLELRDYLRVLARQRVIVIAVPLLAVAVSLLLTQMQTPLYASTAELLFQTAPAESIFEGNRGQVVGNPERRLKNEIRVLTSAPVRNAVREKLGRAPAITATAAPDTDVITIRAESTSPQTAAAVVEAYATAFIEYRQQQVVDSLFSAGEKIQQKLTELQRQIDAAPEAQRDELIRVQGAFRQELETLNLNAELRTAGAQLVAPASVPTEPFSPRPLRNGALALSMGLMTGVGLAFLRDYMDDTIKQKEDVERSAPGLPILGLIPIAGSWRPKESPRTVSLTEPTSLAAEAYRTLRTGVQFLGLDNPVRLVQVTSPNAQEGKTTVLANLAVALSRAGVRVVVICCDLRRPRVHEFLGVTNARGFTSVLLGELSLHDAMQSVQGQERLFVLASGPLPPNPSELLTSARVTHLLDTLVNEGFFVLIDSPPVLPVTDALVLSRKVDATLLVTAARSTHRKELARSVELLRQVDAPLVGAVLNGVTSETGYGYRYSGGYYQHANGANGSGKTTASKNGSGGRRSRNAKRKRSGSRA